MKDLNTFTIIGRLVKAPEKRINSSNNSYCYFDMAVGRDKEKTDFIKCITFGNNADFIADRCNQGDRLGLSGRIAQNQYETKNGTKISETVLVVNEISFFNKPKKAAKPKGLKKEEEEPKEFEFDENDLLF